MQDKADMDRLRDLTADLARAPSAQLLAGRSSTNSLESEIAALDIAGLVLGVIAVIAGIALVHHGDLAPGGCGGGERRPARPGNAPAARRPVKR